MKLMVPGAEAINAILTGMNRMSRIQYRRARILDNIIRPAILKFKKMFVESKSRNICSPDGPMFHRKSLDKSYFIILRPMNICIKK